jgi:hypothetical protein
MIPILTRVPQVDNSAFAARLSLESGVAVSTTDQAAKTTLYLTPLPTGSTIALYQSGWRYRTLAEISLATTGLTASKPHDIFVYDNAGTLTLEAVAWTNDTTRATALATQDGVYVQDSAANKRYVGTVYADASKQIDDSTSFRGVWNMYNRVRRQAVAIDTTDSWSHGSTFRARNTNTTNGVGRFTFILGLGDVLVEAQNLGAGQNSTSTNVAGVSIGLDSTSAAATNVTTWGHTHTDIITPSVATYKGYPGVGLHFLQALEFHLGSNSTTFFGDVGTGGTVQTGMLGSWKG